MKTELNRHLIVISVDALNKHDFEYINQLPNFKSFIDYGAYVREVDSVYPSLTYTAHTSIITGTYPDKHGIFTNEIATPSVPTKQPWFWFEKDIKVPTLFDYAHKANMITANVLWPVMNEGPITYNMPEKWSVTGRSYTSEVLKYASKNIYPMILKHFRKAKGSKQPYLDNYTEAITIDMITKKKPNLLTVHLLELDQQRHVTGLMGPEIEDVLNRMDKRIGRIIEATKIAGIYDTTTFIILGDHGGTNFSHIVYLNKYFYDNGFIEVDHKNNITSWQVYANSCGGSVQIHIHKTATPAQREAIDMAIGKLCCQPETCIKVSYTTAKAHELYDLDGNFAYVLEANDGYIFRNDIADAVIVERKDVPGSYNLDHGHDPNHPNLKTLFMAKGVGIKAGASIPHSCIIDGGPTMAKLLGLEMTHVDGRILDELLE